MNGESQNISRGVPSLEEDTQIIDNRSTVWLRIISISIIVIITQYNWFVLICFFPYIKC